MDLNFLDFEQPIAELEAKVEELRFMADDNGVNVSEEIEKLQQKIKEKTKSIFSDLTSMQIVKVARHPQRPHTLDYIKRMFTDFDELYGDRHSSKGSAIVGGIARLDGEPVMVMGQQKGRSTKENLARNFGMANPEEYRKALRLMKMAEKFNMPVLTFIDTAGAYPGIEAEEHNQSEAIARNLITLARLKTPIVCTVIGEGGSGGALAIGVGDWVMMLQFSIYSVISPEGCASILWRSQDKVEEAANALRLTARRTYKSGLIDQIIPEPLGGAHRDYDKIAADLKSVLANKVSELKAKSIDQLLQDREQKIMAYGAHEA